MWSVILSYISSSIPLSVPLMYGSTGEIITEKSGHLNLGIPGIMYVGAISSVIGSFLYETGCATAALAQAFSYRKEPMTLLIAPTYIIPGIPRFR